MTTEKIKQVLEIARDTTEVVINDCDVDGCSNLATHCIVIDDPFLIYLLCEDDFLEVTE